MRVRTGTALLLALLCAAGLAFPAPRVVTVNSVEGTVYSGETELTTGAELVEGDRLIVGEDARLSVEFPDGAQMHITGPADLRLTELSEYSRTIDLYSGRINRFEAREITTGIHTPYETYVAIREGAVSVNIDSDPAGNRISYMLFEGGETAKVVNGTQVEPLTADSPYVVERERMTGTEGMPDDGAGRRVTEGERRTIRLGQHEIELTPAHGFTVTGTDAGGLLVTCILPEGEYGLVTLDQEQTFYLTHGESIEFDANGNVVRHDAIVHVYAALDRRGLYDEAVADPSDASPIGRND